MKIFWEYAFISISVIGSFASIIAYGMVIGPGLNDQGLVGVVFLGFLCLFFCFYSLYTKAKLTRKSVYSEIFEDLNIALQGIHELDRTSEEAGSDRYKIEIVNAFSNLCNQLESAFSKIKGHHVGVCIKILESDGINPFVTTLVRDKRSLDSNGRRSGSADPKKHLLSENSDFNFLWRNLDDESVDTSCYFGKRLYAGADYRNSSLPEGWGQEGWAVGPKKLKVPLLDRFIRSYNWPLKYKSTIVVPITPLSANDQSQQTLRGFLCVDSPYKNAFDKKVDVNIIRGIADGIYNKIDELSS